MFVIAIEAAGTTLYLTKEGKWVFGINATFNPDQLLAFKEAAVAETAARIRRDRTGRPCYATRFSWAP